MDFIIVSTFPRHRSDGVVDDYFNDDDDFRVMSSDDIPDVAVESTMM